MYITFVSRGNVVFIRFTHIYTIYNVPIIYLDLNTLWQIPWTKSIVYLVPPYETHNLYIVYLFCLRRAWTFPLADTNRCLLFYIAVTGQVPYLYTFVGMCICMIAHRNDIHVKMFLLCYFEYAIWLQYKYANRTENIVFVNHCSAKINRQYTKDRNLCIVHYTTYKLRIPI